MSHDDMVKTVVPHFISLTKAAENKMKNLMHEENNEQLMLRVFITGGGCSGFQYGFSLEKLSKKDDLVVTINGVTLLIDPTSAQYLAGAEVDYEESLAGSRFKINNPMAKTTCGCGQSFSL